MIREDLVTIPRGCLQFRIVFARSFVYYVYFQSIIIWALQSKSVKATLREHEHVVECVEWAPDTALAPIRTEGESLCSCL